MQDRLVTHMLKFIQDQRIDLTDKRILLAVSGGIDSVVMAHLFKTSGIHAGVAHCNFCLRGKDSDEDEEFVRQIALEMNAPFHSIRFDTRPYAQEKNISIQMAARDLRYEWFHELMKKEHYDFLAIAQHAGDNIETIILNLTRGTGLSGVRGIRPLHEKILRPLLFTDRDSIQNYANKHQIKWREDSSNSSDYYYRNQIRHHVLPVLHKINPSVEQNFIATSERLLAADNLVNMLFKKWREEAITSSKDLISISIPTLLNIPEPVLFLSDVLQPYGFNYWQSKEIVNLLTGISGKTFYSPDYQLTKDRNTLVLVKKDTAANDSVISETTQSFHFYNQTFIIDTQVDYPPASPNHFTANLDASKLIYPLIMRQWQTSDRFFPIGMKGKSKKISDLFTDRKLSVPAKSRVGILVNGNGDIIWVAGIRLDERYAISSDTKRIISISLLS